MDFVWAIMGVAVPDVKDESQKNTKTPESSWIPGFWVLWSFLSLKGGVWESNGDDDLLGLSGGVGDIGRCPCYGVAIDETMMET